MDVVLKANTKIMEDVMSLATDTELREMFLRLKGVQKWLSEIETRARAESEARARAEREQERMSRENERLRQEIAALRQAMEARG
jgi:DNA repair exonuclease SbcCD ATPase subunit